MKQKHTKIVPFTTTLQSWQRFEKKPQSCLYVIYGGVYNLLSSHSEVERDKAGYSKNNPSFSKPQAIVVNAKL